MPRAKGNREGAYTQCRCRASHKFEGGDARKYEGEDHAPQPSNVINLMDALRRSIAAEKGQAVMPGAADERPAKAVEAPPKRRAAAAAAPRDKARKSPRPKKPT